MQSEETKENISKGEALRNLPGENLDLLMDTIEGINRTLEFKSIINESMEAVRLVMNSEASSLMLLDEETGKLYVSLPTGPAKEEIKGKSIPKNSGIGGWVVENKRPYITNDIKESGLFWGDLSKKFRTRNVICVPLINRENNVIGVLQAVNRRKNGDFTPHDIPVFQALASHITVAIERAREVDRLYERIREKDVMITEIHHRIKNNLQVVSALIEKEEQNVKDKSAKKLLSDMRMRIRSMSRLHDMLCRKELTDDIELDSYLSQLTDKIEETMGSLQVEADLHLKTEKIFLTSQRALLCGLILNELLLNIYKHAFTDNDHNGKIEVELYQDQKNIFLNVSDNGIGLPEHFDLLNRQSIGLWIVDVMLKKLHGKINVETKSGTRFSIVIPKEIEL
jgi:two-component sensor histidine kinase